MDNDTIKDLGLCPICQKGHIMKGSLGYSCNSVSYTHLYVLKNSFLIPNTKSCWKPDTKNWYHKTTVSYTHLRCTSFRLRLSISLYSLLFINTIKLFIPVSYTHLDVYKRQILLSPSNIQFTLYIKKLFLK